ncbi:Protein like protein [Myotis brandtii]|uniref:Protein like protein n=1 Tax=Myotis brandtii TaxID=109478 RepID=S7N1M9_MYOBR|nr:Protein like protein [Myotis brandtii]
MKKKKTQQEGDTPLGHPKPSWSMETSPRRGSTKKLAKVKASEYIPVGDGLKSPGKTNMKRQCVKEKEFQMMFARDAPERLEKFSGRAAKSCAQLCPRLPLAVFGQLSKNKEAAY